ncbi:MAG TPA: HlyD family efflux transporter periplasmic adaptor subunit [Thermoanaerobaculia bacterium]|nr:HlyD family efflux transporter periplasmic adaptor subunit [Thermoanaerobaculia bacterium]
MDIPRTDRARSLRIRRITLAGGGIAALAAITFASSQLKPAAPSVERAGLWIDQVQRGPMLRQVRGPGTLVPVEVRWISAPVEGRVERIPALPGVEVTPQTVLVELSNPELEQQAFEAASDLRAAEADVEDLRAQLDSQVLAQQAAATAVESQASEARLQVEANEELAKDGLIPPLTLKLSRLRADQLDRQAGIERQRVEKSRSSANAQLAAQRARGQQLRDLYALRQRQVGSLAVRAAISGVLQEMPVEVGQRVSPGTTLARVARPERLKAELRIPETQAKDVTLGQVAAIDTRNGVVPGRVFRIDPGAQDGTVRVDVALTGALPPGARPQLSVDGTIEIERLSDVVFVGRPTHGQPHSTIELFKLVDGGSEAERVQVRLGRTSVSTVEVLAGLQPGDQVILSDVPAADGHDRLRLD